jgi:hypothetical protein
VSHYGDSDKTPGRRSDMRPDAVRRASAEKRKRIVSEAKQPHGQGGIKRFGILQCILDFDDSALRYFVLSMNSLQDAFELEFVPYDDRDQFLQQLLTRESIDRPTSGQMLEFYGRESSYFQQFANDYDHDDEPPHYYQIISMAHFEDNYFQTSNGFLSIIALGGWRRSMAPPSILEFFQIFILRSALFALVPELTSHIGTRGCVMDFSADLADAKQHVLLGHLCFECESVIREGGYPDLPSQLRAFLSKRWLGDPTYPASPAAVVSKLNHDLFITKGLEPSRLERMRIALLQEGVKQVLAVIGIVLAAILIATIGVVTDVRLTQTPTKLPSTPIPVHLITPSPSVPTATQSPHG